MDRAERGEAGGDSAIARAHLVGIGVRGMSGLAQMLLQRGFSVTGSDRGCVPARDRLRQLGIRVHAGHSPAHVPRSARMLVYPPGLARDDPERLAAARLGVPQASHPEVLNALMKRGVGIAVAGARGASAASAMIGWT